MFLHATIYMRLTLNRPISLAQFKEKQFRPLKINWNVNPLQKKAISKTRVKLQALVKSTINKQWAPFKDTRETFRLCRIRTRDSRTSSQHGQEFVYFILLIWNQSKWSQWVGMTQKGSSASRQEKLHGFHAAWLLCSNHCACGC